MDTPIPMSLIREISPPRLSRRQGQSKDSPGRFSKKPNPAAVEAGRAKVADYLAYFTERLSKSLRATPRNEPRLSINEFVGLYQRNQCEHGNHFVIHQHDHPISGVHCGSLNQLRFQYGMLRNCQTIFGYNSQNQALYLLRFQKVYQVIQMQSSKGEWRSKQEYTISGYESLNQCALALVSS
jgi:hypothetical protein